MAIVKDAAFPGVAADKSYCTPNRTNAGTPNGSLTPQYLGEIVFDTTNKVRWKATHDVTANTGWRPMEAEVT